MSIATIGLAFAAGALSTLSPCVLPLLPIVLGSAASQHRLGPLALAGGLALSFSAIGLFVATVGLAIGIDSGTFRTLAALLLIGLGLVLALPRLQEGFATVAGPIGGWAESRWGGFSTDGMRGQFAVGLLLGAVWSPCAGPTLGAASVLASQGQSLPVAALTMVLFGLGAALPLLLLGLLSRERMMRLRGRLMSAGGPVRASLGIILAVVGVAILTGGDKQIETWLLTISPDWLTRLTTSI